MSDNANSGNLFHKQNPHCIPVKALFKPMTKTVPMCITKYANKSYELLMLFSCAL